MPAGQTVSCPVAPKSSPLNDVRIVAIAKAVASARVVAANVALIAPAGTITLGGTLTAGSVLVRNTWAPPRGAGLDIVTVPVEEAPASTDPGLIDSLDTFNCVAFTVSVAVAGVSFGAPDVALIVTVVSWSTTGAACTFAAPPLLVQAPMTNG